MIPFAVGLALLGAACTSTPAAEPTAAAPTPASTVAESSGSLTVYSGRSESLVGPIIKQFGEATGIEVRVKYAGTAQLAATLLEEGANSPADVFLAQEPGGLGAVQELLAPLPDRILSRVGAGAKPLDGKWVGLSSRARTVAYNTTVLTEAELPDDLDGFTDPKWKGRVGWAPTNASFQVMVTAMRKLWGEEKTSQWLKGVQANQPKVYPNNTSQVAAVGAGEIHVALVNHYYVYGFLKDKGEDFPVRNYHLRAGGPGALVMVAGAGVLSTSRSRDAAERFIEFMLGTVAQQYFASQTFEYPVVEGVQTHRFLTPLGKINQPVISVADLADLQGTQRLLRETGVLP
jgi:iron(III) transport system substrate-binding protein